MLKTNHITSVLMQIWRRREMLNNIIQSLKNLTEFF